MFGEKPSHIPQNKLLKILYSFLQDKKLVIFDKEVAKISSCYSEEANKNVFILEN